MQIEDLRIGNYLKALGEVRVLRGISQYNQQHQTQTVMHYFEFDELIPIKAIHIKPIPLTEEWLLKLGFTKEYCDEEDDYDLIYNINECLFMHGEWDQENLIGVQLEGLVSSIKYVHELQNTIKSLKL